jgi:hypothetical protein
MHVRRQPEPGGAGDLAHHQVDRARGQPAPRAADEQRPLALCRDVAASVQPRIERRAGGRVQRDLALRIALARAHDHQPLARRDPHVIDIERDDLRQPQRGVQQHHQDRPVTRPRGLRGAQQRALVVLIERPRSGLGDLLA